MTIKQRNFFHYTSWVVHGLYGEQAESTTNVRGLVHEIKADPPFLHFLSAKLLGFSFSLVLLTAFIASTAWHFSYEHQSLLVFIIWSYG